MGLGSAFAFRGKEVTIQTHGHDKYKRTLADVILPDGRNLNQELVKKSWCWWYRKYALGHAIGTSVEERVYMGSMEYSVKELQEALEKIKLPCL